MAETTISSSQAPKRFDFKRLFAYILHPRAQTEQMAADDKPIWQLPMLALSLALLLRVVVTGYFQARAAAMGETPLPPDWQWWTPEMQNNYMQAMQQTQSPVFVYIIPAVMGLASLWMGWAILSGLLHLTSTLFGGRGKMGMALNIVAWGSLPFAVRDLLRIVFMLIAQHTIASPGLSGFVTASEGGMLFLSQLLTNVDIFLFWHIFLLVIGFSVADSLPIGKAAAGVVIVLVISLLAQAGLGMLSSSLGGMMVSRQF